MKKLDGMSVLTLQQMNRRCRKEPLYWVAYFGNVKIAEDNSLPLLRHKCRGLKCTFRSVR